LGTPALMHSLKQFSMSDKRMGQTKLIRNKIIFEKKIVATEKHEFVFWPFSPPEEFNF